MGSATTQSRVASCGVYFQDVPRPGFSVAATVPTMVDANRHFPAIARVPPPPFHFAAPRPGRYRRNTQVGHDRRHESYIPGDGGLSRYTAVPLAVEPRDSG